MRNTKFLAEIDPVGTQLPEQCYGVSYVSEEQCKITIALRDALTMVSGEIPQNAENAIDRIEMIYHIGEKHTQHPEERPISIFSYGMRRIHFSSSDNAMDKNYPLTFNMVVDIDNLKKRKPDGVFTNDLPENITSFSHHYRPCTPHKYYLAKDFGKLSVHTNEFYQSDEGQNLLYAMRFVKDCDQSQIMRLTYSRRRAKKTSQETTGHHFTFSATHVLQTALVDQSHKRHIPLFTLTRPFWGDNKISMLGISTVRDENTIACEEAEHLYTICPIIRSTVPLSYLNTCQYIHFIRTGSPMMDEKQMAKTLVELQRHEFLGSFDTIDPKVNALIKVPKHNK